MHQVALAGKSRVKKWKRGASNNSGLVSRQTISSSVCSNLLVFSNKWIITVRYCHTDSAQVWIVVNTIYVCQWKSEQIGYCAQSLSKITQKQVLFPDLSRDNWPARSPDLSPIQNIWSWSAEIGPPPHSDLGMTCSHPSSQLNLMPYLVRTVFIT
ncbi:hypothetical protein TNCV_2302761 [Trichonephila clavipes]|nr:hypothetical protein TNCV_2302761 [Trichonephila clavipes]